MIRHGLVLGGVVLASRLLGFARDAGLAWLLGSTTAAEALTTALRLPYAVRRLYAEGALSLEMTATLVKARLESDNADLRLAHRYGRRVLGGGAALLVLLILLAEPLMRGMAPGLAEQPDVLRQAGRLFRLCAGYIPAALLAALCMAVLHGRERFGISAITGILFNLAVLSGIGLAALGWGNPAEVVALSVLVGGLAQWFVQMPAVTRLADREASRPASHVPGPPHQSGPLAGLRRLPLGLAAAAMPQLAFLTAAGLSSFLAGGSLAALFYAERLLEFPIGLLGAVGGMVAGPRFACLAAGGNGRTLARPVGRSLEVALLGNLPAAAGLMTVAGPLVTVLFGHGAFDRAAADLTAACVWAYAPGVPAYALSRPLLAACHALQDRTTLGLAVAVGLGLTLIAGLALMPLCGVMGPPLGASLGLWGHAAVLYAGVCRQTGPLGVPWFRPVLAVGGSMVVYVVAGSLATAAPTPGLALIRAIPAGMAAYAGILCLDPVLRRTVLSRARAVARKR